jgi:hypothetical protein
VLCGLLDSDVVQACRRQHVAERPWILELEGQGWRIRRGTGEAGNDGLDGGDEEGEELDFVGGAQHGHQHPPPGAV